MNEIWHDRKHLHDIDELFRSAIDGHEESPSLEVWENVEKGLDRYCITRMKRKYGNLKKFAVAMVLLLFSVAIFEFQTPHVISGNENIEVKKIIDGALENQRFEKRLNMKKEIKKEPGELVRKQVNTANYGENEPGPPIKISINRSADENFALNSISELKSEHTLQHHELKGSSNLPPSPLPENDYEKHKGNSINDISLNMTLATIPTPPSPEKKSDQVKKPVVPRLDRFPFSLTLLFSPDFTSRRVKTDWPVNREDNRDEIRKSERYAFSYSLGALVDYNINKSWAIQSGFTLSKAVISIAPKFIFARPDDFGSVRFKFNSSAGYSFLSPTSVSRPAFGDSLHAFSSTSSLIYGSIPLALKYKIVEKKFNFFVLAGASVNILVKDKIETSLANGMNHENAINRDIRGVKPVYYSALLAAGATYNFNKTLALSLTPTARLALTSINRDAPVKSYEYSLGFVTGLQISF